MECWPLQEAEDGGVLSHVEWEGSWECPEEAEEKGWRRSFTGDQWRCWQKIVPCTLIRYEYSSCSLMDSLSLESIKERTSFNLNSMCKFCSNFGCYLHLLVAFWRMLEVLTTLKNGSIAFLLWSKTKSQALYHAQKRSMDVWISIHRFKQSCWLIQVHLR